MVETLLEDPRADWLELRELDKDDRSELDAELLAEDSEDVIALETLEGVEDMLDRGLDDNAVLDV